MRNYITPLEFEVYHTHSSTLLRQVEGYSVIVSLILIYAITTITIIRLISSCLECEFLEPIPEEDYTEDEKLEDDEEEEDNQDNQDENKEEEVTNEIEAEAMEEEEEESEEEDNDSSSDYEDNNTDTDTDSEEEERIRQANCVVQQLRQRRGVKRLRED